MDGETEPANNDCPSWSWASIRGPVAPYSYTAPEDNELKALGEGWIHILNASCLMQSSSPCGSTTYGSIAFSGRALETTYTPHTNSQWVNFHVQDWGTSSNVSQKSRRLRLLFLLDTALGFQNGNVLARCALREAMDANNPPATVFLVYLMRWGIDAVLLICSRMSSSHTLCHLGISPCSRRELEKVYRFGAEGTFTLI